jgi:hypothetical protein
MIARNNNTWFWALAMISALFFTACVDPTTGTLNEVYKYPQEIWGEWIRMDTGDTWYIGSNYLTGSYSAGSTLMLQSENVIEITDSGKKYYLYASRTANSSFTGKIEGLDHISLSASRPVAGGQGWINVVVEDLNSGGKTTTQTDADGSFEVEEAIPGDEYQITPEGGRGATVTPIGDGDDVGTITVTDGMNFKTTIKAASSSTDMTRLYAGDGSKDFDYNFTIVLTNTGVADCLAATYSLNLPAGLTVVSAPGSSILGTIEPGNTKSIPITLRCQPVGAEYEYKKIAITVNDPISGKTWDDSVSLKFHKATVNFNIKASSAVSGIIITPTANAYFFNRITTSTVTIPWSAQDFLVVFSGATADTETVYSLGIGVTPDSDFNNFTNAGNYEPNNTEAAATPIAAQDKSMSFLHKNDIDYYKVNLGTTAPVSSVVH